MPLCLTFIASSKKQSAESSSVKKQPIHLIHQTEDE